MRTVVAAIVASVSLAAQAPQQPPVFRAGADLVEVDVVVRDRKGVFVGDLAADDFVIEESGRPQPIQQFYVHATDRSGWARTDGAASRSAAGDAAEPTGRVFVVMFDDAHLTPGGFKRTQAAAETLFTREFRGGDMGGVVTLGRLANNRLTSNRTELLNAVKQAKPQSTKSSRVLVEREFPRLTEIEAVRIAVSNDRVTLDEAIRRACADEPDLCKQVDPEPQIRAKAAELAQAAQSETAKVLISLRELASGLARVPGRKTIVLMSEGFIAEESWPMVQDSVAAATRANARIYTLDARGLERGLASIDDAKPDENGSNSRLLNQMDFGADSTNSLAVDTGGFVVRNTNEFSRAVARIADDIDNYYVLAIRPAAADEKFHRVSVKVKRPGVSVRARRGYVATRSPAPMLTLAPAEPASASPPPAAESVPPAETAKPESAPELPPPAAAGAAPAEATVVARPDAAAGYRVRPDAGMHVRTLGESTPVRDEDATAGWEAYQRGDVETAHAKLAVAAARPSASVWVHYTLGMASYALSLYREAAVAWERVREESPEFEPVYLDLIDAYLQSKDHDHAIRVARMAIERWPKDPEPANALGVVQTSRGALDDAVKSFQAAIAAAPGDTTAYFNLGKALELRYFRTRRYVQQFRSWVSNENDRSGAIENYQRYLDKGGVYADAARAGLERLRWMPTK